MSEKPIRLRIAKTHPIFGGPEWRKVGEDEFLNQTDQTACISTLFSLEHPEQWHSIDDADWCDYLGKTVRFVCEGLGDMDGGERVFRRRVR